MVEKGGPFLDVLAGEAHRLNDALTAAGEQVHDIHLAEDLQIELAEIMEPEVPCRKVDGDVASILCHRLKEVQAVGLATTLPAGKELDLASAGEDELIKVALFPEIGQELDPHRELGEQLLALGHLALRKLCYRCIDSRLCLHASPHQ
ncbi:hypothetical protein SDC9_80033 [bioreactor metagenome]|uniref:Uncharacterized protein n=1 Tax=bioreactor metagenome TaxID=1076179 RepID=A0A644YZI9_9ZZZZ